jgi:NAD(P)-dependent dehydrogenase (short-subunit alcohol dehydrogenase family)
MSDMQVDLSQRKLAVVSGGASGIGQAVILRLAQEDLFPVVLDKDEVAAQETLSELKRRHKAGDFIRVELTKNREVQNAFTRIISEYGKVDVLVNVAGGTLYTKLLQDFPLSEWQEDIDVNLKATFLCCQAVIGVMKQQRKGTVINTASNFGITGSATRTAYSAAKAAIIAFTKSLALELAPYGIRANCIAPGLTGTKRVLSRFSPERWATASKAIPMARAAEPKDIAEGVVFLASEESSYITGQTLHVNGGMVLP